jgi:hypothetical protein
MLNLSCYYMNKIFLLKRVLGSKGYWVNVVHSQKDYIIVAIWI